MVTQGLSLKYKLQLGRTHILTFYLFLLSTANYKVAQRGWLAPRVQVTGWGRQYVSGNRGSGCAEVPAAHSPPSGTSEERQP